MQDDPRIGKTVSHYKIIDYLGGGGMGIVYKAEDLKLKRIVALKFLPVELTRDQQNKVRFTHEAQAASALDHPRIGTIYEIDETENGEMFISMAYYEGETLKAKMEQEALPVAEAIKIINQIANGLAAAHAQGIVHRDIKPANIIITEEGFVKIVDFGIAKLGGTTRITKSGTSMGTPAYMSPEQVRGQEVDHRSDIWSLGVILYELLTNQLPFTGDYEMAVLYSIANEEPVPLSQLNPELPAELEQIIKKTLAKQETERYASMQEMLHDLKELQSKLNMNTPPFISNDERATIPIVTKETAKGASFNKKLILPIALFIILTILGISNYSKIQRFFEPDYGFLSLSSEPAGALISVDGKSTGESTPALLGPLKKRSYEVALSLDGFQKWSENFTITTHDTLFNSAQLLAISVEKAEAPPLINPRKAFGDLVVNSNPEGAQIYLNDQDTGKSTPANFNNLGAGRYRIQLHLKDHKPITRKITIAANQTTKVMETFSKTAGSLFVASEPPGASVYLNDNPTNQKTPYRFSDLFAGEYDIRLTLDAYEDQVTQVTIKPDQDDSLNFTLTAKPLGSLTVLAVILEDDSEIPNQVANIFVNGEEYGQTPRSFQLKSGEYTVTAKMFDHTAENAEQKVTILSGENTTIKFKFIKN